MKVQFFLRYVAFFMSVLFLTPSCQKDNFDETPLNQASFYGKSENSSPETLNLSATQWEFRDDGSYSCNLSDLINKSIHSYFYIVAVSVMVNGQQIFISGTPIDYSSGALWSDNYRNGYTLIYKSSFGEMPFHSLDLTVLITR